LNLDCNRPTDRAVLIAAQPRAFGTAEPHKLWALLNAPKRATNQLPANSAGKFLQQSESQTAGTTSAYRTWYACAPQKENKCLES